MNFAKKYVLAQSMGLLLQCSCASLGCRALLHGVYRQTSACTPKGLAAPICIFKGLHVLVGNAVIQWLLTQGAAPAAGTRSLTPHPHPPAPATPQALPLLPSVWWVLPVELLQGLTFALAWSSGCVYVKRIAPVWLRSTVQVQRGGREWRRVGRWRGRGRAGERGWNAGCGAGRTPRVHEYLCLVCCSNLLVVAHM